MLAAGGSDALETWMTTHKYRYPTGMDAVVEDYVDVALDEVSWVVLHFRR